MITKENELKLEALKLLLNSLQELTRMKSCEVGEKSHMLAHTTEFIKRQIRDIMKQILLYSEY